MVMMPIRAAISTDAGYAAPYSDAIAGANQLHGDIKALWDAAPQTPATTSGTGDVIVSTFVPVPPAYVDGMSAWLVPPGNNTTQPTWDWGPGAKTIKNRKGNALAAGALSSSGRYLVSYHAASGFLRVLLDETELTALTPALPKRYLTGFVTSNNTGDTVNDLDIAAGDARDTGNAVNMLGAAMTKRFDAAWAVGSNQGAVLLSANLAGTITITTNTNVAGSGTAFLTDYAVGDFITSAGGQCRRIATISTNIAMTVESAWSSGETGVTYKRGGKARNSHIRVFAIYKDSDGSVDYAGSARDVPVDLPSGYSKYRRIAYLLTDSSAGNRQFLQAGDDFVLKTKIAEFNQSITKTSTTTTVISNAPPSTSARQEWTAVVSSWSSLAGENQEIRIRETALISGQGRRIFYAIDDGAGGADTKRYHTTEASLALDSAGQFVVENTSTVAIGTATIATVGNLIGWRDRRGRD